MTEQQSPRNYSLQCLRLAADCTQLAGNVEGVTLQRQLHQMANIWTALAEYGPGAGQRTKIHLSKFTQSTAGTAIH